MVSYVCTNSALQNNQRRFLTDHRLIQIQQIDPQSINTYGQIIEAARQQIHHSYPFSIYTCAAAPHLIRGVVIGDSERGTNHT